ncbi:hypothetical protein [Commensalibacter papalotli (ex Botero et al. 2024)]|nr:hypothetical protein [Commensalibacter papalotli (ex Botero et al. 2024)]
MSLNGAQITKKTADGTISEGSITINTGNLIIHLPKTHLNTTAQRSVVD